MAYPFLKAKGHQVGKSLCSDEDVALARQLLAADKGQKIKLPLDHITATDLSGEAMSVDSISIPEDQMGLDIGPKTIKLFSDIITGASTVFWNGPMGLFENKSFSNGTSAMAKSISESKAFTVVGGGDSVAAVNQSGLAAHFSHVSSGGGASLEFIEKGELPGVQALKFGI
jgi:phosphoglycerate kinase